MVLGSVRVDLLLLLRSEVLHLLHGLQHLLVQALLQLLESLHFVLEIVIIQLVVHLFQREHEAPIIVPLQTGFRQLCHRFHGLLSFIVLVQLRCFHHASLRIEAIFVVIAAA